ncbi:MAG: CHAT domain-containing protein [Leptolyngbyaceae cyanobacterium]
MRHPARLLTLAIVTALLIVVFPTTLYPLPTTTALAQSTVEDRQTEADLLFQQGLEHYQVSRFREALASWEAALELYREIGDRDAEERILSNLGNVYFSLENYEIAGEFYTQQLSLIREIGNRGGEGRVQVSLGWAYSFQGQYQLAISYFEKALAISEEVGDANEAIRALYALGWIYHDLGQVQEAIEFYESALYFDKDKISLTSQLNLLNGLGWTSVDLKQYQEAIGLFNEQLAVAQSNSETWQEASALNGLGFTYAELEQYQQAIGYSEQALSIHRQIGDRREEAYALGDIGNAYFALGENQKAIEYMRQCLAIQRAINNRWGEGITLSSIAKVFHSEEQENLAIAFLKASVEVRESIRNDIRGLDTKLQQSFTDTVADDYRLLANLLLEEGRIPEAQQVLDLLKLEELREFANTTRATWTGNALQYTDPEQAVIDAHSSLIALGIDLIACEDTDCSDLETLDQRLEALKKQYDAQVAEFEATIRANRADDEIFQNPDNLSGDAEKLLTAYAAEGQNALLIYPFVLEEKLWLVWAAAGNVIGSVEVPVSQGELATTVQRFGAALNAPGNSVELQAVSQQLYDWIMQPLETELAANGIDHLIFVNDRITRYIPMAALFDGEHYLLERYQISTVLAPGLTDTTDRLASIDQSQVLGLGLTQAVAGFNPLPAVDDELNVIVRSDDTDTAGIYPGQVLLDDDFTLESLKANVRDHRVLHMATHAAFVPGRAEESFVVLGNGEKLTIADIEAMERRLSNLHLVVLSACQTALGGAAGDGTEIAGISSYFLEQGRAETVIASLWAVNDNSTSILMQRFYELLATGELTKAEALRQAQLSLLYDEDTKTRLAATRTGAPPVLRDGFDAAVAEPGYRHPYYWAPFILIGNGL